MTATPTSVIEYGAGSRPRFRACLVPALGGLVLLSSWWSLPGSADAASYPPSLGCAVSASAGSGVLQVRGTGFDAGSRVLISVDGRGAGAIRADAAGSFQGAWTVGPGLIRAGLSDVRAPAATVTASDARCSATGRLAVEKPPKTGREPSDGRTDPAATAIPAVPVTRMPPQLFLGLAGAVLLAGTALTGLTGRLGHRDESRPAPGSSVTSAQPRTPGGL